MSATATPLTTRRWALRYLYVSAPLASVALVAWLAGWLPEVEGRVLYLTLAMSAMSAAIIATVATGQVAVSRAFTAGYMTGLQLGAAEQAARDQAKHLRLVRNDDSDDGNGTDG